MFKVGDKVVCINPLMWRDLTQYKTYMVAYSYKNKENIQIVTDNETRKIRTFNSKLFVSLII